MKVEIVRSNGIQTYEVPVLSETMTVMDILDYIYHNLDHTLAYYRHSSCNQAICGRCLVKMDGKPVLACAKRVDTTAESIRLSPASDKVVRDLVIDN
jgi:succinate dehydrogenase/fumarate reductase-like Fe-S protein